MLNSLGLYFGYTLSCFAVLIFAFIFYIFQKLEDKTYLGKLFFYSLLIKLIIIPLYYMWLDAHGFKGFSFLDDQSYDSEGWLVAKSWLAGRISEGFEHGNVGFNYFTSYIYYIFGHNTLAVRAFNALAGSLCIFYTYKIAKYFFNRNVCKIAAFISAFYPNLIYWSINHFKDPIIILMTIVCVYFGTTLIVRKKLGPFQIFYFILSLFILYLFRYAVAIPLCILIFAYFYFVSLKDIAFYRFIIVTLILISLAGAFNRFTSTGTIGALEKFQEDIESRKAETVEKDRSIKATTSHMVSFGLIRSYRDFYKFPIAVFIAMLIPYPPIPAIFSEDVRLPSKVFSSTNFFHVCILSYIIVGWFYLIKHKKKDTFLIYFVPSIFIASMAIFTLGVFRYREQFVPFFSIMAAIGIWQKNNFKPFIYSFNILFIGIAPIIYWILKAIS